MVRFKAIGVLSEPSKAEGKFVVVVSFKQITEGPKGLEETELSQQKFTVASDEDLATQCEAVLAHLKATHEHTARTLDIGGKVIAEVTTQEAAK